MKQALHTMWKKSKTTQLKYIFEGKKDILGQELKEVQKTLCCKAAPQSNKN